MKIYCDTGIFDLQSLDDEPPDSCWILDLQMNDYRLSNICILEEIESPTLTIRTKLGNIYIPPDWYVMIGDDEFCYDIVKLSEAVGRGFRISTNGCNEYSRLDVMPLEIVNYNIKSTLHIPMIKKSEMLCIAVDENKWIHVSPSISNKYIKLFDFYDL